MNRKTPAALPRAGVIGIWDRIVGPGMPAEETHLIVWACAIGTIFAAWRFGALNGFGWGAALAGLIGFDVIGGAVCNATQTTKRWYNRTGTNWQRKLAFVLPHLGYVALIAWLWREPGGFDVQYFITFSAILLAGSAVVLLAPTWLAAPVASAAFVIALTCIVVCLGLTHGLEWFAPALLLKLLFGHLVPPQQPSAISK
jgi:hypothetical protein